MRALLSIIALYKYNPDLFDLLHIPDGLDREALIDELCMQLGELNLIITDPDVLKEAIDRWSRTRLPNWEHFYETMNYEYNPIWNKDGVIKEVETRDLKATRDGTLTGDDKGSRSAFNESDFQNVDRSLIDHKTKDAGTDTGTVTRERTEKGNIGIVTTQQMIREEREIAEFSIYNLIINEFMLRFCIMVY